MPYRSSEKDTSAEATEEESTVEPAVESSADEEENTEPTTATAVEAEAGAVEEDLTVATVEEGVADADADAGESTCIPRIAWGLSSRMLARRGCRMYAVCIVGWIGAHLIFREANVVDRMFALTCSTCCVSHTPGSAPRAHPDLLLAIVIVSIA